jgi:hypothetical protein
MLNVYEKGERVETFFFETIAQIADKKIDGKEAEMQGDSLYDFIDKKRKIIVEKIKNEKV